MKVSSTPVYSSPALQSPSEHASTTTQASSYDATLGLSTLLTLTLNGCQTRLDNQNLNYFVDPSSYQYYPDGKIKSAVIIKPCQYTIESLGNLSVELKVDSRIEFYPNGTLKGFVPRDNVTLPAGIVAKAGSSLYLTQSGKISLIYLAQDYNYNYLGQHSIKFKANTPLTFHGDNYSDVEFPDIYQGTLAEGVQFENYFLDEETCITLSGVGFLESFYTYTPIYYHGLFFKAGEYRVTMGGYIIKGEIHTTSVFDNIEYKEGTVLEFSKANEVLRVNGNAVK